jgi:RHS repeat-associated protein
MNYTVLFFCPCQILKIWSWDRFCPKTENDLINPITSAKIGYVKTNTGRIQDPSTHFDEVLPCAPGSREGTDQHLRDFTLHTIPIALSPFFSTEPLVPKDFSHSGLNFFETFTRALRSLFEPSASLSTMTKNSFGKLLSIKDGAGADISANPVLRTSFTFTGREFDDESGLYYYRARSYNADIGRFLQVDPSGGNLQVPLTHINKHIYAGNNPNSNTDPFGQEYGKGGDNDFTDRHGYYCGISAHGQQKEPFNAGSNQELRPEDGLDNICRWHDRAYSDWADVRDLGRAGIRAQSDLDLIGRGIQYTLSNEVFNRPLDGIAVSITGAAFLYAEFAYIIPSNILGAIGNALGIHIDLGIKF